MKIRIQGCPGLWKRLSGKIRYKIDENDKNYKTEQLGTLMFFDH